MITWRRGAPQKGDEIVVDDGEHEYSTKAMVPLSHALRDFISGYKGKSRKLIATNCYTNRTETFDCDSEG